MVLAANLFKKIPIIKIVENEKIKTLPVVNHVLTEMDPKKVPEKLGYGSLFCDGEMIAHKYYPLVVKKQVYYVLDSKVENNQLYALVKTVGIVLIQDMFSEKKIILNLWKTDNLKSEKKTVVTGFFDHWYIKRFPDTLFFSRKPEYKIYDLSERVLFSLDLEKVDDLIQKQPHQNCEFFLK